MTNIFVLDYNREMLLRIRSDTENVVQAITLVDEKNIPSPTIDAQELKAMLKSELGSELVEQCEESPTIAEATSEWADILKILLVFAIIGLVIFLIIRFARVWW